jgi:addiction module RelE/StbE family toxin
MKVLIREAVYHDLDRIHSWIAKDRPRAANSVVDRILKSAERLGELPYIGHAGRVRGTYEWVVTGLPYILVYKIDIDNDEVQIIAVFHGARDR